MTGCEEEMGEESMLERAWEETEWADTEADGVEELERGDEGERGIAANVELSEDEAGNGGGT